MDNHLQIEYILTDELIPHQNNPNTHDEKQIAALCHNILNNKWTDPIQILPDKTIVAGHGRLMAAKRLGIEVVPTITVGEEWTEEEVHAYMIAHNALSKRSVWHSELLPLSLQHLHESGFDMELVGMPVEELSSWLGYDDTPMFPEDAEKPDKKDVVCPHCGKIL